MKRYAALIAAVLLAALPIRASASAALAGAQNSLFPQATPVESIDLSSYTLDELVALQNRINLAMWEADGWQEVTVPQGVYKIGEAIPAGKWTIKAEPAGSAVIRLGTKLNGADVSLLSGSYEQIVGPQHPEFSDKYQSEVIWDLPEGSYFQAEYGPVTFTPFTGYSFDFK